MIRKHTLKECWCLPTCMHANVTSCWCFLTRRRIKTTLVSSHTCTHWCFLACDIMCIVIVASRAATQGYNTTLTRDVFRMRSQRRTRRGFWTTLHSLEERELWRGWKWRKEDTTFQTFDLVKWWHLHLLTQLGLHVQYFRVSKLLHS
jgi:hypothetical protein